MKEAVKEAAAAVAVAVKEAVAAVAAVAWEVGLIIAILAPCVLIVVVVLGSRVGPVTGRWRRVGPSAPRGCR